MATQYPHRLVIVATNARAVTVNQWIRSNLDAAGGDWLSVALSPTGAAPGTHLACSCAVTTAQARLMMRAICQALALTQPDPGGTFTRAGWKAWLGGVLAQLRARGVSIQWSDNDGDWSNPEDEKTAQGLKVVVPAPGSDPA